MIGVARFPGFGLAVLVCLLLGLPGLGHAQGAHALGDPAKDPSTVVPGGTRTRDPDPMGPAGVGLKLGVGFIPAMELQSPLGSEVGTSRIPARSGLLLALPLHLGDGHGLGVDLEPFFVRYQRDTLGYDARDTAIALGGYFGASGRFQLGRVYFSVGLGVSASGIRDDLLDFGINLFGRIPISATYYVSDGLGISLELGLAYGGTGVQSRIRQDNELIDGLGGGGVPAPTTDALSDAAAVQFGHGFAMETTLGLRFP